MAKTSSLPPGIIQIILSKSSLKPLLRFKSVSKSWNSIISDPQFVKNHHQQSKSSNSQDLFLYNTLSSSRFNLVKLEDQNLEFVQKLQSPYGCSDILCRYGGVLLLTDFDGTEFMLWNPSTRTHKQIWIPFQTAGSCYGLFPDPTTDTLKIVVVNSDNYSVSSVKNNESLIFTRKRSRGLYADYGRRICNDTPVCVDGAVYWVWSRRNVDEIIYYDPRDDEFKVLQKPKYIEKGKYLKRKKIYLVDLGGSLCLRCEGGDTTTIMMWIKEKGIGNDSWKEWMTIENENVKMGVECFEPQCVVGNKILFRIESTLVVYSPLEKKFERLGPREFRCDDPGLIPYLDSPVNESKRKRSF